MHRTTMASGERGGGESGEAGLWGVFEENHARYSAATATEAERASFAPPHYETLPLTTAQLPVEDGPEHGAYVSTWLAFRPFLDGQIQYCLFQR